ncbi:MAG: ester cyclase [Devosia sp.]|uniref:ester cyclase n=1 Tax=Devosia sp. TaxID=1871048 RepID=UPI0024CA45D6|nr:ester cyclase [Devosia sp.]UYO01118.1 MAG: ester cyclase [Devosia sp.]
MSATPAHNIDLMKAAFAALNRRDIAACIAMLTPDFQIHVAGAPPRTGQAAWRSNTGIMFTAFPDAQVHVEDMFATEDKVAVRARITGTHTGNFLGQPATGNAIAYDSIEIYQIRDGRIAAEWICSDTLTMMTQAGIHKKGALLALWLGSFKVWIAAALGIAVGALVFAWL